MRLAAPEQEGVDATGKVGSARAAPLALGPPSPGPPRLSPRRRPARTQQPFSRAGTSPPQSLQPGPEGQSPRLSPQLRARGHPARGRTALASRESIHSRFPCPGPEHGAPASTRLESRVPQHVLHTLCVPKTEPRSLTWTPASTPGETSPPPPADWVTDGRQHVHDTFAIAVKGYRVGTGGERAPGKAGLLGSAPWGPAPSVSIPQARDPAAGAGGLIEAR